jgi:hypothetical protein
MGVKKTTHKTSWSHYQKYEKMSKDCTVRLDERSTILFGVKNVENLRKMYEYDPSLSSISNKRFDGLFAYHDEKEGRPKTQAENANMYRHCLIYHVLGIKPNFTDKPLEE